MPKFASLDSDGNALDHDYGNIYFRQPCGDSERLIIGPSNSQIKLLDALAATYPTQQFYILYILLLSHAGRTPGRGIAVQISEKISKSGKMEPTEEENDQFTRRKIRGFGLEILKNDPKLLQNNPNCFKMLQNASKCFKILQNASRCFKMFQKCFKMLQNASKLLQNASKCFKMLQNASNSQKMF